MSPLSVAAVVRRLANAIAAALALWTFPGAAVVLRAAPAERSEPAPLAAKSLLLDVTRAGEHFVAVGDRGHVLISRDDGRTWSQSVTPTRAMLTCVSFANPQHGWAAGHDGVILATSDGGITWTRQDDTQDLETVYLDIFFLDANRGFVVGAYGKFLETADGGKTWTPRKVAEEDVHFNRLSHDGARAFYLAGELGTVLISRDQCRTWTRSPLDYEGSIYGVRPLSGGLLVAYGLRGRIFVSTDDGASWEPRETEVKTLVMAGARLRDGVAVLAGQGGNFFVSRDACRSFHHWKSDDFGTSVADMVVASDGALITVGEAGAVRIEIP